MWVCEWVYVGEYASECVGGVYEWVCGEHVSECVGECVVECMGEYLSQCMG